MHKQTILIVDDVMLNRAVIRGVLKKQFSHVEFHEADDGIQAMNAIEKYDVDLVILDLLMPNKDGFEVLKALKADKQYEGIPIIVISSLQDIESIQKALELGAYEYFTKPFSSNQLEVILPQKVRNALTISRRSKFLPTSEQQKKLKEIAYKEDIKVSELTKKIFEDYIESIKSPV